MTFTPDADLAYSATYEVTIGTGAEDLAGNPLAAAYIWDFTTGSEPDNTPPTVTGNTPTGTDVPVTSVITVTFDESMDTASVEGAFSTSPSVTGTSGWSGNTMTFTPDADLAYSATYEVTIGTGAEDLAGNPLAAAYIWDFTTGSEPDNTPPTVTTATPSSPVSDIEGASRTFSIDIDQTVNVTWLLDGAVVKDTEKGVTSASYTNTSAVVGTWNVSAVAENANGTDMWTWDWIVTAAGTGTFDTCGGTYPSIRGTHKGNFTPNCDITVNKMYTYPCKGTGGHSEYVAFYENGMLIAEGTWSGYLGGDYHNIVFDAPFTLHAGVVYNYEVVTGSYPQMIHSQTYGNADGTITCTEFVDANGKVYTNRIPAIRLE